MTAIDLGVARPASRLRPALTEGLRRNRWWITRLLMLPVHLLVFTVITFVMIRSIPGDPVVNLLGDNWTQADYDRMQQLMGLDGSLPTQLVQYLGGVATLDLGTSISTGSPVLRDVLLRLPQTLELAVIALALTVVVSVAASSFVIMRPTNPVASALRGYARAAGALPEYVLAVAFLLVFYSWLRWAPAPLGRLDPMITPPRQLTGFPLLDALLQGRLDAFGSIVAHLVLPISVMVIASAALLVKILIVSLDQQIDAPSTRFRLAAGVGRGRTLLAVYRRAAPPAAVMLGMLFGSLLGGAIIIEQLFGFSGLGQYAIDAVATSDYVALQGFMLVIAAATLIVFLLVDMTNMLLDPRRRPGVKTED